MQYEYIADFISTFWRLLCEMAPWLLLGFLFSGILKVFIPTQFIHKHLSKNNFSSVIKAALFGIPLPLCSCGVIPMASSLKENGVSKGAISSFLISTPQTGVDSIFATYSLLGFPFAILRVVIALISGIIGGVLTSFSFKKEKAEQIIKKTNPNLPKTSSYKEKLKEMLHYGFFTMIQDLAKWIFVGLFLATLVSVFLPENLINQTVNETWKEFLLIILIAIPLYVCATGSIPIALSLALKGISPGAILIFLMLGPATNIATITVLTNTLGKKFTFIYLISIILCSIGFGILINNFFPLDLFNFKEVLHIHNSESSFGINQISGIILILLIINALILPNLYKKKKMTSSENSFELKVEGMTCNHCKSSVENKLKEFKEITSVEVDLSNKKVIITTNEIHNKEHIIESIEGLGFVVSRQN